MSKAVKIVKSFRLSPDNIRKLEKIRKKLGVSSDGDALRLLIEFAASSGIKLTLDERKIAGIENKTLTKPLTS